LHECQAGAEQFSNALVKILIDWPAVVLACRFHFLDT
jgi:hypothetical protein